MRPPMSEQPSPIGWADGSQLRTNDENSLSRRHGRRAADHGAPARPQCGASWRGHDACALIEDGFLGDLREVRVYSFNAALADPAAPLSWRQDAALSGYNMLTLGIVHETLLRWAPPPVRVLAQVHAFLPSRIDPQSGVRRPG